MFVEDRVQDRLVEFVVTPSVTAPAKPLRDDTMMLDELATPTLTLALVGLAEIVKSCTWKVTVAECDSEPLVPVTVAR
jgi:hypothetical protein